MTAELGIAAELAFVIGVLVGVAASSILDRRDAARTRRLFDSLRIDPTARYTIHRVPWRKRYDVMGSMLGYSVPGQEPRDHGAPTEHPEHPGYYAHEVECRGEGLTGESFREAVITTTYRQPAWTLN